MNSDDKLFALMMVATPVCLLLYLALRIYAKAHGINVD